MLILALSQLVKLDLFDKMFKNCQFFSAFYLICILIFAQGEFINLTQAPATTTVTEAVTTTAIPTTAVIKGTTVATTANTNSECSSTVIYLTASAGTSVDYITSINYGTSNYDNDMYCSWLIAAPTDYAVQVNFTDTFSIEYNSYCNYDFVRLYNGNSTSSSVINSFCGYSKPTSDYTSSLQTMFVTFTTDYSITYSGFKIQYTAIDNSYPACKASYTETNATYNIAEDFDGSFLTISTPNYGYSDYSNNIDIYWFVTNFLNVTHKIVLDTLGMDVEWSSGCVYDNLIIYNGPCVKDGILDTVCGTRKKRWDLLGAEYLLHFHSDGSTTKNGFSIEYYIINIATTAAPTTTTTTNGPPVGAVVDAINAALQNYSNENLPTRDLSTAINVSVDVYLVGINQIDEVQQKLTSTAQFEVTWVDANLAWLPAKRNNIVRLLFPQNDIWRPDLALLNGFSKIQAMGAKFMLIDVDYNGSCVWRPYQIMESVCQIDMTYFPYDTQICILQFGTWGSSDNQVITQLGANGLQIHDKFQRHSEWELVNTRTETSNINAQEVVKFYLTLKRNPKYITFYITVPTVALAFLNVFMFMVPCESGEKSGFAISVFLSFVVVLIVVNDTLPDNSDNVSLYSMYTLSMAVLSCISTMTSVCQIRFNTFTVDQHPIGAKTKACVRFVQLIQNFFSCGCLKTDKLAVVHNITNTEQKSLVEETDDTSDKSSNEDNKSIDDDEPFEPSYEVYAHTIHNMKFDKTMMEDTISEDDRIINEIMEEGKSHSELDMQDNDGFLSDEEMQTANKLKGNKRRVKFKDIDTISMTSCPSSTVQSHSFLTRTNNENLCSTSKDFETDVTDQRNGMSVSGGYAALNRRVPSAVSRASSARSRPMSAMSLYSTTTRLRSPIEDFLPASLNRPMSSISDRLSYGISKSAGTAHNCTLPNEVNLKNDETEEGIPEESESENGSISGPKTSDADDTNSVSSVGSIVDDNEITWTDIVRAFDAVLFIIYFIITSVLTIVFFILM